MFLVRFREPPPLLSATAAGIRLHAPGNTERKPFFVLRCAQSLCSSSCVFCSQLLLCLMRLRWKPVSEHDLEYWSECFEQNGARQTSGEDYPMHREHLCHPERQRRNCSAALQVPGESRCWLLTSSEGLDIFEYPGSGL